MGTARGEGREGCLESEYGVPESGRERLESGRERPESERERPESERGAVDSFLVFTPILLTMILVFALFDYGASTNELTNQAKIDKAVKEAVTKAQKDTEEKIYKQLKAKGAAGSFATITGNRSIHDDFSAEKANP